ncbi:MAG: hypothetical protein J6U49_05075 [Alistipes sp.]|nr:hypothetical protein [Alistipes sp.]
MATQNLTTVVDIQVKNSDAINALYKYNVALQEVTEQIDELKKAKKSENGISEEQARQLVMLTEKHKALKKEMGEMSRQVQNNIIAEGKYQDTLKGLGAQLSVAKDTLRSMEMGTIKYGKALEEARNQLNKMERGTAAFEKQERAVVKLQAQMDEANNAYKEQEAYVKSLNDRMKESEEAYGVFTRNVGNYKESAEMLRGELEGMREGIDGLRGGLDTVSQIMALTGTESEGLQKAIKGLTVGFTALDAVNKLVNSTIKGTIASKITLGIQTKAAAVSTKLETAATTGNTVAKKAATIAQKALNAAMKANPIVLLISVIVAAGAALLDFAEKSDEATKAQEEQKKAIEEQAEAIREFNKSVAEGAAENITKYELLRKAYSELRNEHEKTKWIKENKDKISDLGFAVDNVNDAELLFVKNTDKIIKAYKLRAEAAAYESKLQEVYAKRIELESSVTSKYKAGDKYYGNEVNAIRDGYAEINRKGEKVLTAKGAERQNTIEKILISGELQKLDDEIDRITSHILNLQNQATNLTSGMKRSGGDKENVSKSQSTKESLADTIDKEIAAAEKAIKDAYDAEQRELKLAAEVADTLEDEYKARRELMESEYSEELIFVEHTNKELELLEIKHQQDMLALEKEYADKSAAIAEEAENRKREAAENTAAIVSNTLGGLSDIFTTLGEDNKEFAKLGKQIALAQVAVDTGVAIAKGVGAAMSQPFPANLAAVATTIATVMSNINTAIQSINSAKFSRGGYVSGPGSATSDSIPASLSNGESVNTARATSMFGPMLSAFNVMGGGVPIVAQTSAQLAGEEMLARAVAKGVAQLRPVVSVAEINRVQNRVSVVNSLGNV